MTIKFGKFNHEPVDLSSVKATNDRYQAREWPSYEEAKNIVKAHFPNHGFQDDEAAAVLAPFYNSQFYANQFYANEEHENVGGGQICTYVLNNTPVAEGTAIVSISRNNVAIQTLAFGIDNNAQFIAPLPDGVLPHVTGGNINPETGVISLVWNDDPGNHKISVQYEDFLPPPEVPEEAYDVEEAYEDGSNLLQAEGYGVEKKSDKKILSSSYIDYLVDQLSDTKDKLKKAEEKIASMENLEIKLYEEYDQKVKDVKDFIVRKLDQFLKEKTAECVQGKTGKDIFEEAMNG